MTEPKTIVSPSLGGGGGRHNSSKRCYISGELHWECDKNHKKTEYKTNQSVYCEVLLFIQITFKVTKLYLIHTWHDR